MLEKEGNIFRNRKEIYHRNYEKNIHQRGEWWVGGNDDMIGINHDNNDDNDSADEDNDDDEEEDVAIRQQVEGGGWVGLLPRSLPFLLDHHPNIHDHHLGQDSPASKFMMIRKLPLPSSKVQ